MMKAADSTVPSATSQMVARWTALGRGPSRTATGRGRSTRKRTPRAPRSPAARRRRRRRSGIDDQVMPNWNSCTSPVATPTAKLISISVPKKRVSRSYSSSPGGTRPSAGRRQERPGRASPGRTESGRCTSPRTADGQGRAARPRPPRGFLDFGLPLSNASAARTGKTAHRSGPGEGRDWPAPSLPAMIWSPPCDGQRFRHGDSDKVSPEPGPGQGQGL